MLPTPLPFFGAPQHTPGYGHEALATRTLRPAFTLVELLTTLVLIAVLAAILIPAIGTIHSRAAQLKCAAKMRNLYQAVNIYQTKNLGQLPPNHAHSGGSSDVVWSIVLRPYLEIDDMNPYGAQTAQMLEQLTCPAVEEAERPDKWWESNYAAGTCFGTDGVARNINDLYVNPGNVLMFVESSQQSRSLYRTPRPWTTIGYHHDGKANLIFLDGHLELRTAAEIPESLDAELWGLNEAQ